LRAELGGKRFGALVVLESVETTKSGQRWRCRCDCGGECIKLTTHLKRSQNPGCRNCEYDRRSAVHRTHGEGGFGLAGKHKSKLYMIWKGMHSRCRDQGNTSFRYYGERGIKVCSEWASYETFRDWALMNGYQPGLTIDRKFPHWNYAPYACEWVPRGENTRRAAAYRRQVKARAEV
jgi:hypothetical protein